MYFISFYELFNVPWNHLPWSNEGGRKKNLNGIFMLEFLEIN
jgi:hypothetical protein